MRLLTITVGALVAITASFAAMETLNNESIVKLHKLGFEDSVIIEKIRTSICKFDTSTDALMKLKEEGVSSSVITTMIGTSGTKDAVIAASDPNDPDAPHDPGIWLYEEVDGNPKMTKIEPSVFEQTKGSFAFFAAYGQESKTKAVLGGAHAKIQTSTSKPVLYFYFEKTQSGLSDASSSATTPEDFTFTQMEVNEKKNERRVTIGKHGLYAGSKSGIDTKKVYPFEWEKKAAGVFKVTPKDTLPEHEYAIMYTGATPYGGFGFAVGGAGAKAFCFGVHLSDVENRSPKQKTNKPGKY